MATKISQKLPVEKELVKAKAREQVAHRKLDNLKERFDKLKAVTDAQLERHASERELADQRLVESLEQNEALAARCKALQDEAAMWKSQLFDQLDRLDDKQQETMTLQNELAQAQWQLVELVDLERGRCEQELAVSREEVDGLQKQLIAARARVDGLKNLGACLAAKLERETARSKVLQRDHARVAQLAEQRSLQVEARDSEIDELKGELFEARRIILAHRLESESWDVLKAGLGASQEAPAPVWDPASDSPYQAPPAELSLKTEGRRPLKLAAMPAQTSQISMAPKQLLHRASKTVGGWFKLGSKS